VSRPLGPVLRVTTTVGYRAAKEPAQSQSKLSTSGDVEEEVAGVVRHTHLVDDVGNGLVDDEALPVVRVLRAARRRRVVRAHAVEVRPRKYVAENVDEGGRKRGEDDVEGDGQQHRVGGGVLRRRAGRLVSLSLRAGARPSPRHPSDRGCHRTGVRHAPDLTHHENVDDQNDERNGEKDDHLCRPRPHLPQRLGVRPQPALARRRVVHPQVRLDAAEQATTDDHSRHHFHRPTCRAEATFLTNTRHTNTLPQNRQTASLKQTLKVICNDFLPN